MNEMDQFRDTYISECYELLQEMEELLIELDEESQDLDTLNAIFRCAHSIKGGAGAFGFNRITGFTHILEALLDGMREGLIMPSREAINTLLSSVDVVTNMVRSEQVGDPIDDDYGKDIEEALNKICSEDQIDVNALEDDTPPETDKEELAPDDIIEVKLYNVMLTPYKELLASGNEPLLLLRELDTFGDLSVTTDTTNVPFLDEMVFDNCYFHWDIDLETDVEIETIQEIFEFVEDECDLSIMILASFEKTAAEFCKADNSDEVGFFDFDSFMNGSNDDEIEQPPFNPDDYNQDDDSLDNKEVTQEAEQKEPEPIANTAVNNDSVTVKTAKAKAVKKTNKPTPEPTATSIRVDVEKVDRLVNMAGELVITQAVLHAQTRDLATDQFSELIKAIEDLSMHTRELQEAVMSVRMQPIKSIFSRLPRIVRDLSQKLNKKIKLEMHGENTEIDKTVIEQLGDPLTHMIRNSVDHGIEKPDIRLDRGKPEEGTIVLSANHRGGRIVIEISDDGNGIDRTRVFDKAVEKGLIAADAVLEDEEIDNLIFQPGFSTAAEVSDISGRGVGMDVVKRNIESLGGNISIANDPGKGSVVSVSLPLTLAILDGMIVRIGTEHYIIPINNIIETTKPKEDEINKIANGNDVINTRGEFVTIIYLHNVFGIRNACKTAQDGLVVLVENGREKFGLVVDELLGQQQVVIKTLNEYPDSVKGISGATILGDGKVSLIIDVAEISNLANLSNVSNKHMNNMVLEQQA